MNAREALELIRKETEQARLAVRCVTGQKKAKLMHRYYQWQSGLEVAENIYHSNTPDALERIMAIKLDLKLEKI